MRKILFSLGLCLSASAYAENCGWEYQIVEVGSADELLSRAGSTNEALSGLQATLNKLGAVGWELVSEHQIQLYTEMTGDIGAERVGDSVARIDPGVGLFKKPVACLSDGGEVAQ